MKNLTLLTLTLATSAFAKKDWDNWGGPICRGGHYEDRTVENADDLATRERYRNNLQNSKELLDAIKPRYNRTKRSFESAANLYKLAGDNLDAFKNSNAAILSQSTQIRGQMERVKSTLNKEQNLKEWLDSYLAETDTEFKSMLSYEMKSLDLSLDYIAPSECPKYAEFNDAQCRFVLTWYKALESELSYWKDSGVDFINAANISNLLKAFVALQRNSQIELETLQSIVERKVTEQKTKLEALTQKNIEASKKAQELGVLEATYRAKLLDHDTAQKVFQIIEAEYNTKANDVKTWEERLNNLKIRTSVVKVYVPNECP
jgi:hypothetical protein